MFKHKNKFAIVAFTHLILLSAASPLLADDIPSVFYISKNDNANQVHYGIRLNQECAPMGSKPVYVYWKKENGTTRELIQLEQAGYGISSQSVSGQRVDITLNAFQNRGIQKPIAINSVKLNNGRCQASAFTTINGKTVQLSSLQIQLNNISRNPLNGGTIGGTIVNLTLIASTRDREVISCTSDCRFGL